MSEAAEFVRRYADTTFRFSSYYKYAFSYTCEEEPTVFVSAGGGYNDIYRADLDATMTLRKLLKECGTEFAVAFIGDDRTIDLDPDDVWDVLAEEG